MIVQDFAIKYRSVALRSFCLMSMRCGLVFLLLIKIYIIHKCGQISLILIVWVRIGSQPVQKPNLNASSTTAVPIITNQSNKQQRVLIIYMGTSTV